MKLIPLNTDKRSTNKNANKYFAQVDDEDYNKVFKLSWHIRPTKTTFYAAHTSIVNKKKKTIYLHRFILNIIESDLWADHIDHNGLNCQKSNIRRCTQAQNSLNKKSLATKKSKWLGVFYIKNGNTWLAKIQYKGKVENLGFYKKEIFAAIAYNRRAVQLFGEFANLNKIKNWENIDIQTSHEKTTIYRGVTKPSKEALNLINYQGVDDRMIGARSFLLAELIAEAMNEGFTEKYWWGWYNHGSGFVFSCYVYWNFVSYVPSRLLFETENKFLHAIKTFPDVYKQLMEKLNINK